MPSLFRLVFPFAGHILTRCPRIYSYAAHPEKAPLKVRYNYCREAALSLLKLFRIKFIISGQENIPEGQTIFCPNHQSNWDPVTMLMILDKPCAFLAKAEISTYPIIDGVLRSLGGDYLFRGFPLSELRTIKGVGEKLKNNPDMSYIVWPEGTRTPDVVNRSVGEFKSGAFRIAQISHAPIVPVAMYGTYELLDFSKKDKRAYPVQVTFLEPLTYEEYKDMKPQEIADIVHQRVFDEVARQRQQQPVLEEYWNEKENAKAFKKETKELMDKYWANRKVEKKLEAKEEKEWRKTHPALPKNKKPKLTKEQKAMIKKQRQERHALVEHYKSLGNSTQGSETKKD